MDFSPLIDGDTYYKILGKPSEYSIAMYSFDSKRLMLTKNKKACFVKDVTTVQNIENALIAYNRDLLTFFKIDI